MIAHRFQNRAVLYIALSFMLFALVGCNQPQTANAPTWQEQYDLGVRYLAEGNYAEAIIAFSAAIEIDAKQAPAYKGLSDAYVGIGNLEEAINALSSGFAATSDTELGILLTQMQEELAASMTAEVEDVPPPESETENSSSERYPADISTLEKLFVSNISYHFNAGEDPYNPDSMGLMEVSGNYQGSSDVQELLIAGWRNSWSDDEIEDMISFIVPIWKDEITPRQMGVSENLFGGGFPIYAQDSGQDYDVLFVGLNSDIEPVAYALVPVHVP